MIEKTTATLVCNALTLANKVNEVVDQVNKLDKLTQHLEKVAIEFGWGRLESNLSQRITNIETMIKNRFGIRGWLNEGAETEPKYERCAHDCVCCDFKPFMRMVERSTTHVRSESTDLCLKRGICKNYLPESKVMK